MTAVGSLLYHLFIILLNCKFKGNLTYFHSAFILCCFHFSIIITLLADITRVNTMQILMFFQLYIFSGILINVSWIITNLFVLINLVSCQIFNIYYLEDRDSGIFSLIFMTSCLGMIVSYLNERS